MALLMSRAVRTRNIGNLPHGSRGGCFLEAIMSRATKIQKAYRLHSLREDRNNPVPGRHVVENLLNALLRNEIAPFVIAADNASGQNDPLKARRGIIAQRTGENVLSTEGHIGSSNSQVSSVDAQGQVSDWPRENQPPAPDQGQIQASAGVSDAEPTPVQQSARAQAAPAPAPEPANADVDQPAPTATTGRAEQSDNVARNEAPSELPRTASPLPLSGLIGLLSLGGALGIGLRRR